MIECWMRTETLYWFLWRFYTYGVSGSCYVRQSIEWSWVVTTLIMNIELLWQNTGDLNWYCVIAVAMLNKNIMLLCQKWQDIDNNEINIQTDKTIKIFFLKIKPGQAWACLKVENKQIRKLIYYFYFRNNLCAK